ncbi:MAG: hypothetical protein ABL892_08085 [Thiobacillaceae bacterium]
MTISWLVSIIFSCAIALTAFGAVYRPEALGFLAASPGVLLIASCLPLVILMRLMGRRTLSSVSVNTWRLLGYGIITSALSLFIFGWSEKYFAKSGALLVLTAVWLSPLLYFDYLRVRHLRIGLVAALVFCIIGYLVGDLLPGGMPLALQEIVFGSTYQEYYSDTRAQGFMQETSHFASLVGRYTFLVYLLRETSLTYSAKRLTIFMVGLIAVMAIIGSKGAAISVIVAVLSISITKRQLPYFILFAPVLWWVGLSNFQATIYDIENFTSGSTRITLALASVSGLIHNPLGYGYYGFYGAIQQFGGWSIAWLGDRLPLIFTEVATIVDELHNVSTKSTLLDFVLVYGIFFVWMMLALIRRIELRDPRARAACIYLLFSALTTSGHESISFFLGFAVLIHAFPKKATSAR